MNDVTHSTPGALTAIEQTIDELAREAVAQTGAAGASVQLERWTRGDGSMYSAWWVHLYSNVGGAYVGAEGVRACGNGDTFTIALLQAGLSYRAKLAESLEPAAL